MLNDKDAVLVAAELDYIRAKLGLTPAQLKAMTESDVNTDNMAIMTAMNLMDLQQDGTFSAIALQFVADYVEQFNRSPNVAVLCARYVADAEELEVAVTGVYEEIQSGLTVSDLHRRALGEALLTWALRKTGENEGDFYFLTAT